MREFAPSWFIVGICFLVGTGCTEQTPQRTRTVSPSELIEFNRQKAAEQRALLDSIVPLWHVREKPFYRETETGIRFWTDAALVPKEHCLETGDTVEWVGHLALLDSTELMHWTAESPFRFLWNQSDWPTGFHEVASLACAGSNFTCLLPAHLGWGLTGWPPLIPQDAVLVLRIQQRANSAQSAFSVPSNRLQWNGLLDALEAGSWSGDSAWIRHRQLAASPCIAWYDSVDVFDKKPESILIELRTLHTSGLEERDLGWSKWEFQSSDEGQLLPVLSDLIRLYPLSKKWECWCPADVAFGSSGLKEAGILPGDVVGFQWEFSEGNQINDL